MDLVAKKGLKFAGKRIAAGEKFSASSREGKALKALGLAAMVPASNKAPLSEAPPAKRPRGRPRKTASTYGTKDMQAATPPPLEAPEYGERYGDPFGFPRSPDDDE